LRILLNIERNEQHAAGGLAVLKRFEYLSPAARAVLRHIKSVEVRTDDVFPISSIVVAMRRQGWTIGATLDALEESRAGGWLLIRRHPGGEPDWVSLTMTGSVALELLPATEDGRRPGRRVRDTPAL